MTNKTQEMFERISAVDSSHKVGDTLYFTYKTDPYKLAEVLEDMERKINALVPEDPEFAYREGYLKALKDVSDWHINSTMFYPQLLSFIEELKKKYGSE